MSAGEPSPEALLVERIATPSGYRAFGEFTVAEVEGRADELGAAAQVPAMASRLAPVAAAWRGLATEMRRTGAARVADLGAEAIAERAGRLWIVPPGGSLL